MYFRREKFSTTYPPVDTNFINDVPTNPSISSQYICSLAYADGTGTSIIDRQFYGFEGQTYHELKVLDNGVETGTTIQFHSGGTIQAYPLPNDKIIYGYTVTPTTVNLWTDPTYIDKSLPVMYGRRGLYVDPNTDDFYDWEASGNGSQGRVYFKFAVLHAYRDYGLFIRKTTEGSTTKVELAVESGWDPYTVIHPKFALRSDVISTGTVEQEINQIQTTVNELSDQIEQINQQVNNLVPELTKLVSAEASKNYVAR